MAKKNFTVTKYEQVLEDKITRLEGELKNMREAAEILAGFIPAETREALLLYLELKEEVRGN